LDFLYTFVSIISHSKKNKAKYCHKCTLECTLYCNDLKIHKNKVLICYQLGDDQPLNEGSGQYSSELS